MAVHFYFDPAIVILHDSIAIRVKFSMLLFSFTSRVLQFGNRWHSQRSMKFILVPKEIRLFHLKVLLTLQNICSYRTDELGNGIGRIYYIVLSETRKKFTCCNENIQHCCFKRFRGKIIRKSKFNCPNN